MRMRFMNVWKTIIEREGHTVSRQNVELVHNLEGLEWNRTGREEEKTMKLSEVGEGNTVMDSANQQ